MSSTVMTFLAKTLRIGLPPELDFTLYETFIDESCQRFLKSFNVKVMEPGKDGMYPEIKDELARLHDASTTKKLSGVAVESCIDFLRYVRPPPPILAFLAFLPFLFSSPSFLPVPSSFLLADFIRFLYEQTHGSDSFWDYLEGSPCIPAEDRTMRMIHQLCLPPLFSSLACSLVDNEKLKKHGFWYVNPRLKVALPAVHGRIQQTLAEPGSISFTSSYLSSISDIHHRYHPVFCRL